MIEKNQKWSVESWDKVIDFMTEKVKRLGRASGSGFYDYPEGGKKYLWPQLKRYFPISKNILPQEEMIDRMLFAQGIETIRCYEEGVLNSIADANIGSIFGWGFPAFKGGTLQYVNDYGVQKFLKRTIELEKSYGDRFAPPKLLTDFVDQGKTFT